MYVKFTLLFKFLCTITLMMITILQDRNTYFAYIGVPHIGLRPLAC